MFSEEISLAFCTQHAVFLFAVLSSNQHVWTDLDLKFEVSVVKMTCFEFFFIHFVFFFFFLSNIPLFATTVKIIRVI